MTTLHRFLVAADDADDVDAKSPHQTAFALDIARIKLSNKTVVKRLDIIACNLAPPTAVVSCSK